MANDNVLGEEATIHKGLMEFGRRILETRRFLANEFMEEMEPLYAEAGYRKRKPAGIIQKVLVIHDSGVGDFINFSASLRELRRVYPKAEITLVIYPRYASLAEECPYIDRLEVNARSCRWDDFMQLYAWNVEFARTRLLPHHFDMVFVFNSWGSSVLLGYMSGASVRVGFSKGWEDSPRAMICNAVKSYADTLNPDKLEYVWRINNDSSLQ